MIALLIFAAALWGFGFIAVKWMLPVWDPMASYFLRFLLASILMIPFFIWKKSWNRKSNEFKYALLTGSLLGLAQIFQTWGLKYTTSAKSGFITTLYVMIVPLIMLIQRHRVNLRFWSYCFSAIFGIFLLGNLNLESFNIGDFLSLICAFFFALHIIFIEKASKVITDPIEFNGFQNIVCAIIGLAIVLVLDTPIIDVNLSSFISRPVFGLIFLALGSSIIAFSIQVIAQKTIKPHLAGLIFLMESPFAALFGILFLSEELNLIQVFGCLLIIFSIFQASITKKEET